MTKAIIPLVPPLLTGSSNLPGRANGPFDQRPYLVLLHAGFGLPRLLPAARWAFTPPFHPVPGLPQVVCFLCHFPSGRPARALPGALPYGVRTFLSRQHFIRLCPCGLRRDGYCRQRLPGSLRQIQAVRPSGHQATRHRAIHLSPVKFDTAQASYRDYYVAYR